MTFRGIYEDNFEFVWRALRRLGVHDDDVSDAVQEVFMVVYRKLDVFEGRSSIKTWLYGISMRVASDRRRRAHVKRESYIGQILDEIPDMRPNAEHELQSKHELAILEHLLDQMSLEHRAVFTLFELDEHTSEEIAVILEIPIGTVYSRLRRARVAFENARSRLHARQQFDGASPVAGVLGVR